MLDLVPSLICFETHLAESTMQTAQDNGSFNKEPTSHHLPGNTFLDTLCCVFEAVKMKYRCHLNI